MHLVAGDPNDYSNRKYVFNVEDTTMINDAPSPSNRWIEATKTITVTDGKLTVSPGTDVNNNSICFIEIDNIIDGAVGSGDKSKDKDKK